MVSLDLASDDQEEEDEGRLVLSQLPRQILCLQVRVSAQHAQVFVAGDACDLHDVETLLE